MLPSLLPRTVHILEITSIITRQRAGEIAKDTILPSPIRSITNVAMSMRSRCWRLAGDEADKDGGKERVSRLREREPLSFRH